MTRRAPAQPDLSPPPPCRANPDRWHINMLHGTRRVTAQIRSAAAACGRCAADSPAAFGLCAALAGPQLDPRTIVAGQVISVRRDRVDPERFIAGSLHQMRPRPADYLEAGREPPR